MKIVKIVLSIILAFALMLGIIATTVTIHVSKMLNKDYILAKFDEVDLYNQLVKEVNLEFENYIYQSGIDSSVLDDLCTKEKVQEDIKIIVDSLFDENEVKVGYETEFETSEMRAKLEASVDEFVKGLNRKISKEEEENIALFEDAVIDGYKKTVGYYKSHNESIHNSLPKAISSINKAKKISIIITIASLIAIILINIKTIFSGINYIAISFMASGILLVLINFMINSKININNLLLYVQSLSSAAISIIREFLNVMYTFGMWYILIGGIGILIASIKKMDNVKLKETDKISVEKE